jgi:site-specific DNA-methyltransferase (adenine-specific)
MIRVEHDDMLLALPRLVAEGVLVDSVVCDPPYHLSSIVKRFGGDNAAPAIVGATGAYARASSGFMGKQWDGGDIAFRPETWRAVFDVLKPGGHLIAFSGCRTYHRMVCAIEDAGFEIREMLSWTFGSGFPKSHNIGNGLGTALKPAHEPICLARKPLARGHTVAANVLAHGTGALNIDGCRIGTDDCLGGGGYDPNGTSQKSMGDASSYATRAIRAEFVQPAGRWPANLIHDGSDEVLAAFPDTGPSSAAPCHNGSFDSVAKGHDYPHTTLGHADNGGTAARFFYSAKADATDRCGSKHPTVKPTDLMAYLCRLITPPGGTVLDPFAGSGSTGMACLREGFDAILIEREAEYVADIRRRIAHVSGMDSPLFGAAA